MANKQKEIELLQDELDAATISLHFARDRIKELEQELLTTKRKYTDLLERYIYMREQRAGVNEE